MKTPLKGIVECHDCEVWADIPTDFNETKHFAKCPKCQKPMYLSLNTNPEEIGLQLKNKVTATLLSQREYYRDVERWYC